MKSQHVVARHNLQSRLNLVGKAITWLTWGLGLSYIISEAWMWYYNRPVMIESILASFADSQPLLLSPAFHLSVLAKSLLMLLDMLPIAVTSLICFFTGLFFLRLSRNELWTTRNFRVLWTAGIMNIASPVLYSLSWMLQSLALSLDLPAGERILHLSLGLTSSGMHDVVVGIILCAFAWMIRESTKIHEEHALYI